MTGGAQITWLTPEAAARLTDPCTQFGLAYGLLQADFPDRFLLHYFTSSAHSYTRGSLTTPESSFLDRSSPSIAYASVGQTIAPIYLKWALIFEDLRSRTLWLGKALPREWLAASVRHHVAPLKPPCHPEPAAGRSMIYDTPPVLALYRAVSDSVYSV